MQGHAFFPAGSPGTKESGNDGRFVFASGRGRNNKNVRRLRRIMDKNVSRIILTLVGSGGIVNVANLFN
jgi:hypothetical protein